MEFYHSFLNVWHKAMWGLTGLGILSWFGITIFHWIRQASISDPKAKYDYISKYEVKLLFLAVLSLAISGAAILNTLRPETVALAPMWWFVRIFVTICIGTLIAYVAYLILKYTYPSKVNRKLQRLRYKPRINPKTGQKMRLLSEEEEDVHLDQGMQAEENIFSVD